MRVRFSRHDTIKAGQTDEHNTGEHADESGICKKTTSHRIFTSVDFSWVAISSS